MRLIINISKILDGDSAEGAGVEPLCLAGTFSWHQCNWRAKVQQGTGSSEVEMT